MSNDELACIILGRHDVKAAELSVEQLQAIANGDKTALAMARELDRKARRSRRVIG
jgi:hypothetical protein